MRIKTFVDEDFVNYKKPSMFIGACSCSGKCWKERGLDQSICQNDALRCSETIRVNDDTLIQRYLDNKITSAIVWGGLEPLDQFDELLHFINKLRTSYRCNDDVVIYTGYYPNEVADKISQLESFRNVIIKYGRYVPNQEPHFDEILGVSLASPNQFAQKLGE